MLSQYLHLLAVSIGVRDDKACASRSLLSSVGEYRAQKPTFVALRLIALGISGTEIDDRDTNEFFDTTLF